MGYIGQAQQDGQVPTSSGTLFKWQTPSSGVQPANDSNFLIAAEIFTIN